jgi:hypothetical protein
VSVIRLNCVLGLWANVPANTSSPFFISADQWVQMCIVPLGFIMLALAYSQHHCNSTRDYGMPTAPFFAEVVPTTFYCFLIVSARGATYILLLSYCPAFGFAVMGLMILANFAVLSYKSLLNWGCPDDYTRVYTPDDWAMLRISSSLKALMSPYNNGREMNSSQNLVSLLCVSD